MTPEELRWRAGAYDPEKARRNLKLQYILLGCCVALIIGWTLYLVCTGFSTSDWFFIIALGLSLTSTILGIVNNKRILSGKRPWGDI